MRFWYRIMHGKAQIGVNALWRHLGGPSRKDLGPRHYAIEEWSSLRTFCLCSFRKNHVRVGDKVSGASAHSQPQTTAPSFYRSPATNLAKWQISLLIIMMPMILMLMTSGQMAPFSLFTRKIHPHASQIKTQNKTRRTIQPRANWQIHDFVTNSAACFMAIHCNIFLKVLAKWTTPGQWRRHWIFHSVFGVEDIYGEIRGQVLGVLPTH